MTDHARDTQAAELARQASQLLRELLGRRDSAIAATLHEIALRCDAEDLHDEADALWAAARAVVEPVASGRVSLGGPLHDEAGD